MAKLSNSTSKVKPQILSAAVELHPSNACDECKNGAKACCHISLLSDN